VLSSDWGELRKASGLAHWLWQRKSEVSSTENKPLFPAASSHNKQRQARQSAQLKPLERRRLPGSRILGHGFCSK